MLLHAVPLAGVCRKERSSPVPQVRARPEEMRCVGSKRTPEVGRDMLLAASIVKFSGPKTHGGNRTVYTCAYSAPGSASRASFLNFCRRRAMRTGLFVRWTGGADGLVHLPRILRHAYTRWPVAVLVSRVGKSHRAHEMPLPRGGREH